VAAEADEATEAVVAEEEEAVELELEVVKDGNQRRKTSMNKFA